MGEQHRALGHFNFSDLVVLKAIADTARQLNVPVVAGVSEGEREFVGVPQAAALVKSYREEFGQPITSTPTTRTLWKSRSLLRARDSIRSSSTYRNYPSRKTPSRPNKPSKP